MKEYILLANIVGSQDNWGKYRVDDVLLGFVTVDSEEDAIVCAECLLDDICYDNYQYKRYDSKIEVHLLEKFKKQ